MEILRLLTVLTGVLVVTNANVVRRQTSSVVAELCSGSTQTLIDIGAQSYGIIRSPSFGQKNYANNIACKATFRTQNQPLVINLKYNYFSLEYESYNCGYDRLCVHGVQFCGGWLSNYKYNYVVPAYSTFTLDFRSDSSVTDSGFQIEASARVYNGETIAVPTGGTGTSSGRLTFSTPYLYTYNDVCAPSASDPAYNKDTASVYYSWLGQTDQYNMTSTQSWSSYYNTTSYPYYNTTSYPYWNTTYYPYYNTTSYPYWNTTSYPYWNTTSYPYGNTTYYPYYNTTYYPYYNTTYYPNYNTTYYPNYNTTSYQNYNTTTRTVLTTTTTRAPTTRSAVVTTTTRATTRAAVTTTRLTTRAATTTTPRPATVAG